MLFGERVEQKYFCDGGSRETYAKWYPNILHELLCRQKTEPLYKGIKIGNIMVDNNIISLEELDKILEDSER